MKSIFECGFSEAVSWRNAMNNPINLSFTQKKKKIPIDSLMELTHNNIQTVQNQFPVLAWRNFNSIRIGVTID